jgi:Hsp90 protein
MHTPCFHHTNMQDYDEPLTWVHFKAEGDVEFKSLLYIPKVCRPYTCVLVRMRPVAFFNAMWACVGGALHACTNTQPAVMHASRWRLTTSLISITRRARRVQSCTSGGCSYLMTCQSCCPGDRGLSTTLKPCVQGRMPLLLDINNHPALVQGVRPSCLPIGIIGTCT